MFMKKIRLGDVLKVKRGKSLPGEFNSMKETPFIRLTLGNFSYPMNGFKQNTSKDDLFYSGYVEEEFILNKGDIITPLTEQVRGLLGSTAIIPESKKYIQSGDIGLVIPNEKVLDKNYAFYLIQSKIVRDQLSAAAQQTKIRHTSPEKIEDCIAWIPDIRQQEYIGHLLYCIDKKIRCNTKINDNLSYQSDMVA